MPNCRNCGARLTRFDKDLCPVCGCKKPLEGVTSETIEITSQINIGNKDLNYKSKTKKILFLLFALLGWLGFGLYYIYNNIKQSILYSFINILLAGCLFILFNFVLIKNLLISILVCIGTIYLINIVIGIIFITRKDLKDYQGEFIR